MIHIAIENCSKVRASHLTASHKNNIGQCSLIQAAVCWRLFFPGCRNPSCGSRYNRQGHQAKNRRSRDSYSNTAYTRTQTVRNKGTHNLPLHLTRATIRTNDLCTLVYIGDLSPQQHRTARSSCQVFMAQKFSDDQSQIIACVKIQF